MTNTRRDDVLSKVHQAGQAITEAMGDKTRRRAAMELALEALELAGRFIRQPIPFRKGQRVRVAEDDFGRAKLGTVGEVTPHGYVVVNFDGKRRQVGEPSGSTAAVRDLFSPTAATDTLEIVYGDAAEPRHVWDGTEPDPICRACHDVQTDANERGPCRKAQRAGEQFTLPVVVDLVDTQRTGVDPLELATATAIELAKARGFILVNRPAVEVGTMNTKRHYRFECEIGPDAGELAGLGAEILEALER